MDEQKAKPPRPPAALVPPRLTAEERHAERDRLTKPPEHYVEPAPRQRLVDQRATNAQTIAFVADQQATIADQAEALAKEHPGFEHFAEQERANRDRLQAVIEEERRLATEILFEMADELTMAAQAREHRMELLEVARAEERLAEELLQKEQEDPTVEVLAEQARRNQGLLLHVADTERAASVALRGAVDDEEDESVPGLCITGSGLASGMGIGSAMAMIEGMQETESEEGW